MANWLFGFFKLRYDIGLTYDCRPVRIPFGMMLVVHNLSWDKKIKKSLETHIAVNDSD